MAQPTVSAGYARALMEFAIENGAASADLSERSGIDGAALGDPDARIPLEQFIALMHAAKALCNDPALALKFGSRTKFDKFSVVGLICYAASSMIEAFTQMNRFGQLVIEVEGLGDGHRFEMQQDNGELWLIDRRANPDAFPELTESTWARFIGDFHRYFGDQPFEKAVHVTHPRPAHGDEYEAILNVPVTFSSDRNALQIDPAWLAIEIEPESRYTFGVLSERAENLLRELQSATTMRGRVENLLIPLLHTGELSMEAIAAALGVSRQTLYRKLKSEQVSFETVLDELRHTMALHYLDGRKVSVNETAYLVGFSEASSFSRAFKRWTGASPRGQTSGRSRLN